MSAQTGITTKLFVGTQIRPDLRLQLDQSPLWKQIQAVGSAESEELEELNWRGKVYIGCFVHGDSVSLEQLASAEDLVRQRVNAYTEEVDVDKLPLLIFPQTFIA